MVQQRGGAVSGRGPLCAADPLGRLLGGRAHLLPLFLAGDPGSHHRLHREPPGRALRADPVSLDQEGKSPRPAVESAGFSDGHPFPGVPAAHAHSSAHRERGHLRREPGRVCGLPPDHAGLSGRVCQGAGARPIHQLLRGPHRDRDRIREAESEQDPVHLRGRGQGSGPIPDLLPAVHLPAGGQEQAEEGGPPPPWGAPSTRRWPRSCAAATPS